MASKVQPDHTHYKALEVPPTASLQQIKAAYRKLVLLHHPDKNPEDREGAEARFKVIQNAYEALNPDDSHLSEADGQTSPAPNHGGPTPGETGTAHIFSGPAPQRTPLVGVHHLGSNPSEVFNKAMLKKGLRVGPEAGSSGGASGARESQDKGPKKAEG